MTADTETIREALEEMCPYLERKVASFPNDGFARLRFERVVAALAALGRVEEREAAYREIALQGIRNVWKRTPQLTGETPETRLQFLVDGLLLSSAAGSGEE